MRHKSFAEYGEVALVDDSRSGINPSRQWRRWGGAPVLEIMHSIVMQIVQELHPVIGHNIGFLRDRGVNAAPIHPVQRFGIFVEGYDRDLAGHIDAVQRASGPGASRGFEA